MLALNLFSLFALPVAHRGWFGLRDNSSGAGEGRPRSSNDPQDHLGSIRLLTDEKGSVTERMTWGPWGERLEGGERSRFGYTGHQREAASGLHYSVHRYLDPRNGRWTRRDPLGNADGENRYWYADNDPVRYMDLLGLLPQISIRWDQSLPSRPFLQSQNGHDVFFIPNGATISVVGGGTFTQDAYTTTRDRNGNWRPLITRAPDSLEDGSLPVVNKTSFYDEPGFGPVRKFGVNPPILRDQSEWPFADINARFFMAVDRVDQYPCSFGVWGYLAELEFGGADEFGQMRTKVKTWKPWNIDRADPTQLISVFGTLGAAIPDF